MRESRSYGSVGERGGNEPLYPEVGSRKVESRPGGMIASRPGQIKLSMSDF